MIKYYLTLLMTIPAMVAAADRVGDFSLLDQDGFHHGMSWYDDHKAIVFLVQENDNQAVAGAMGAYSDLKLKYEDSGIEFMMINPMGRYNREAVQSQVAEYGVEIPVLMDDARIISESLGIERAGEVLLFDPRRFTVEYRGPVESADKAIRQMLAGEEILPSAAATTGPIISYPMKESPSYVSDVAPILAEQCATCHREGGVAPFAMDSHTMVQGWSPMIREVLLNKRMPPMQVDPYIGHSESARYLDTAQMQTLLHWIDAGAPRGSAEFDPLENYKPEIKEGWVLGEPDYIVFGQSNEVPPTGVLDYIYEHVDLPFAEDKWLRAIEYKAGDPSVLHHLMTFITEPGEDFWGLERSQTSAQRRFLESYSPGKTNVKVFHEGTGVFIPKGHGLSMQFHYVTNGQRTADVTKIGLYFSEKEDLRENLVQVVSSRFVLPPNEPNFEISADFVFGSGVVVTGVRARMNYRGKRMKFAIEERDELRGIFSAYLLTIMAGNLIMFWTRLLH